MEKWFNSEVAEDWMDNRQKMMALLQEEAELEEIVKMVGMDALSPSDRLKMEAARSIVRTSCIRTPSTRLTPILL